MDKYDEKALEACRETGYGECDPKCVRGIASAIRDAVVEELKDADTAICNAFLSDRSVTRRTGARTARLILRARAAALAPQGKEEGK